MFQSSCVCHVVIGITSIIHQDELRCGRDSLDSSFAPKSGFAKPQTNADDNISCHSNHNSVSSFTSHCICHNVALVMATPKCSNVSQDLVKLRVDTRSSIRKSLWPKAMLKKKIGGHATKTSERQANAEAREDTKVELRGYKNGTVEAVHPISKMKESKSVRFDEKLATKVREQCTHAFTQNNNFILYNIDDTWLIACFAFSPRVPPSK